MHRNKCICVYNSTKGSICRCACVYQRERDGGAFLSGPVRDGLKRNSNEATRAPGLPGSSIPAGVTVLDR